MAQQLYDARGKTVQQIADLFSVPRSTVYRRLDKDTTVPRQPQAASTPDKARHSSAG
ncbi:helix-turn-helix domain-containing protein [Nonomuraea dietziae]|uniref:helix-turn-helix domain-containing protein n=1 Tax=Nonomuraea dietziae TaxID=65515 RepID=UPI00342B4B2B